MAAARASESASAALTRVGRRAIRTVRDAGEERPQLRVAVKELRLDLIELERKVRTLERNGAGPGAAETAAATPAHDTATPRVTVICALYNHAEHVARALDSVHAGRYDDWEIVVTDDGSTDDSGSVVEEWIASHPERAALLVRHPVNRGLPAARNTALAHARGEYVLVLDADNELYPGCIERLAAALDQDPEAAFAYGILEQFDRSGALGLSGYFPWEPERLARENYIDALALVRRERLAELGGYGEERRIYGWEDYDLWCRMADRGWHAAHVPEIVARYRLAPGSMISLTNLSDVDAREAIADRSPGLFAGAQSG